MFVPVTTLEKSSHCARAGGAILKTRQRNEGNDPPGYRIYLKYIAILASV